MCVQWRINSLHWAKCPQSICDPLCLPGNHSKGYPFQYHEGHRQMPGRKSPGCFLLGGGKKLHSASSSRHGARQRCLAPLPVRVLFPEPLPDFRLARMQPASGHTVWSRGNTVLFRQQRSKRNPTLKEYRQLNCKEWTKATFPHSDSLKMWQKRLVVKIQRQNLEGQVSRGAICMYGKCRKLISHPWERHDTGFCRYLPSQSAFGHKESQSHRATELSSCIPSRQGCA